MTVIPIQMVAQDIVDAVTPLMGGRTVLVAETGGTVVASSDPSRVGAYHGGAAKAAADRSEVRIQPDEVNTYPGSREGIVMPVVKNGELLGAVAIRGVPEEVEQAAHLLGMCIDLYLDQAISARKSRLRQDMRLSLLRRLLAADPAERQTASTAAEDLGLELRLPVRVLVVSLTADLSSREETIESLGRVEDVFTSQSWLDKRRDVMALLDGMLVVVQHDSPGVNVPGRAVCIHGELEREISCPVGIGLSASLDDFGQLRHGYHEASVLAGMGPGPRCMDDLECQAMYFLSGCLNYGAAAKRIEAVEDSLRAGVGSRDLSRIMRTIEAYCSSDCSGGKAAQKLGIHKNTMNYRINKIISCLGMEDASPFIRELFLRLLLLRHVQRERYEAI